jgi:hypothetical protein
VRRVTTSIAALDYASGNATIKPEGTFFPSQSPTTRSLTSFSTFSCSKPAFIGRESYSERMGRNDAGANFYFSTLAHDADINFTVTDASGLTAVGPSSTSGIKEAKHFDVSGVAAILEISTWSLMMLGFAGLGYAAFHRGAKARLGAAMA